MLARIRALNPGRLLLRAKACPMVPPNASCFPPPSAQRLRSLAFLGGEQTANVSSVLPLPEGFPRAEPPRR